MGEMIARPDIEGLERSCGNASREKDWGDWIRFAPVMSGLERRGIERLEAQFTGHAYDDHRHDTYALGLTLSGVQSFDYRGARQDSAAGQVMALHPDEAHNGRAGIEGGFRYRMIYVAPHLIAAALAGRARYLPFLREAVSREPRLVAALHLALGDIDQPLEELAADNIVTALAEALLANDPTARTSRRGRPSKVAYAEVDRARQFLDAHSAGNVTSEALEKISGLDRFALTRQFRAVLGTSPYNYLIMRRLEQARRRMAEGYGLADAAHHAGFADQSHFTRQFKRSYGLTPGRWRAITQRPKPGPIPRD